MSNTQLIDIINPKTNYSITPNELSDAICASELSGLQLRALRVVERMTIGYHVAQNVITASYIAKKIRYTSDVTNIRKAVRQLIERKILIKDENGIGFNPALNLWITARGEKQQGQKQSAKQIKNNPPNRLKTTPIKVYKENIKENDHSLSIHACEQNNFSQDEKPKSLDQFELTKEHVSYAKDNELKIDIKREHLKFIEYHRSTGKQFKCIDSAFRHWLLNARPEHTHNKPRGESKRQSQESQVNTHIEAQSASEEDLGIYKRPETIRMIEAARRECAARVKDGSERGFIKEQDVLEAPALKPRLQEQQTQVNTQETFQQPLESQSSGLFGNLAEFNDPSVIENAGGTKY